MLSWQSIRYKSSCSFQVVSATHKPDSIAQRLAECFAPEVKTLNYKIRILVALLFSIVIVHTCYAQDGAIVRPQNLAQMTDEAATVVQGRVLSVRMEPHPQLTNLQTVVVTLQVDQVFKGQSAQTYTFRQYSWDYRGAARRTGYAPGQNLLLLMTKPSQYGLSSPVGLEQGRFQITADSQGQLVAANGHGNAGLFANMTADVQKRGIALSRSMSSLVAQQQSGPISLNDLTTLIRQLVGAQQ
jgi:hypothetical protein